MRKAIAVSAVVGGICAGAAAVSGCGASSAVDPVAQAAQVTAELPGARIAFSERVVTAAIPAGITLTGAGYVDQRDQSAYLAVDAAKVPGLGGGSASGRLVVETRGGVLYMRIPAAKSRTVRLGSSSI